MNTSNVDFEHYGGSGIRCSPRWDCFENFLADMGERPSRSHTLDRMNPFGHYEPGNCKWSTRKEQASNTLHFALVEHCGRKQTLAEWSEELSVPLIALRKMVINGLSLAG